MTRKRFFLRKKYYSKFKERKNDQEFPSDWFAKEIVNILGIFWKFLDCFWAGKFTLQKLRSNGDSISVYKLEKNSQKNVPSCSEKNFTSSWRDFQCVSTLEYTTEPHTVREQCVSFLFTHVQASNSEPHRFEGHTIDHPSCRRMVQQIIQTQHDTADHTPDHATRGNPPHPTPPSLTGQ